METVYLVDLEPAARETLHAALGASSTVIDARFEDFEPPRPSAEPFVVLARFAPCDRRCQALCGRLRDDESSRYVPLAWVTRALPPDEHASALDLGADDVLSLPTHHGLLSARLRALLRRARHEGRALRRSLETQLRQRCDELARRASLSAREREVLDLLLLGRSLGEIATALQITPRTAKFHQANLLEKLGADSRLDLLRLFIV